MMNAAEILRKSFKKKQKENSKFSMRWLASHLKLSPSMMSNVLSGKRNLPPYLLDKVCELLDISKTDRDLLLQARLLQAGYAQPAAKDLSRRKDTPVLATNAWERATSKDLGFIKDWYYVAILEMSCTKGYDGSAATISRRLGVPQAQVKAAMEEMIDAGLLSFENGSWRKSIQFLEMQSNKNPETLRKIHISHLENAKNLLHTKTTEEDKSKRLITGITLTVSSEQVANTRLRIMEFIKTISSECSVDEPDRVYHFAVQFFPLDDGK